MAAFIFTISLLSIFAVVGVLFAWMVRLASTEQEPLESEAHVDETPVSLDSL